MIIGMTGVGKSTTYNYLCGSKLSYKRIEIYSERFKKYIGKNCLALNEGETEFSPIGVGYISQTKKLFVNEIKSNKT